MSYTNELFDNNFSFISSFISFLPFNTWSSYIDGNILVPFQSIFFERKNKTFTHLLLGGAYFFLGGGGGAYYQSLISSLQQMRLLLGGAYYRGRLL